MKNNSRVNLYRYIILISFLLVVNAVLGIVISNKSGAAFKEMIQSRMLDISNTAADMINGDDLRDLKAEDKGTPEYDSIVRTLKYFQDNMDLNYIYSIKDMGNKNFVFGVDCADYEPAEFGAPAVYTEALYTASLGTPAADNEVYHDQWGTFYSAYSPVFDSNGNVAGIIAVDFSKEWYDKQMASQRSAAALITAISFVLGIIMVVIISNNARKRSMITEQLSKQLASTADIYVSMHEIDFTTDTFVEVQNNKSEASELIGKTRDHCQMMIRNLMEHFSDPSSRDSLLDFVDFSKLNNRLKDCNTITSEFLSADNEWRRARFIVSDRDITGAVTRAMYLIEDIDAEKRERDMSFEVAKLMNEQISSVANIYFTMHEIDIPNDTFTEIKTDPEYASALAGSSTLNAQTVLFEMTANLASRNSRRSMHDFVNFETLDERLKNKNTITEEFLNNNDVWCRGRFVVSKRTPEGKIDHVIWLIEGIDEEKRKRDEISEAAKKLNTQMASISNIFMSVFDIDLSADSFSIIKSENAIVNGFIKDQHTGVQNLLRESMRQITDDSSMNDIMSFVDFSTLDDRLKDNESVTLEIYTKTKKWVRVRFMESQRMKNGRLSHVIWLAEDISAEKLERDKLIDMSERALAASEAKSSFLSNMSHEIRTPINAVLGMNEMILRECDDRNILAYSESIRTAGSTLLGLINDILDFSKIEAGKMEILPVDYDLSSVINDLVNMIQNKADSKGLQLVLEISRKIPKQLHGDEVRIKQIITNILTNAVKYTEKGSVTFCIDYEKVPDDPGSIILEVAVKDTGIGIKPDDMRKLFSEFDRIEEERNRKVEGTGLGMSITKRLLEMMDSTLEVESIYELGSKFSFRLKQTVVKWEELGDYEAAYRESLGKRKKYHEKFRAPMAEVLVVDDTAMNITVFRSLLKRTEIRIDTASSGDEALALAYDKKYDMIFLDHMMPEKDGIETLHEIKAQKNNPNLNTPSICLTANAISGAREQYIAAGFDDYLTKPIISEKLEEMLVKYLPKEKILGTVLNNTDDEEEINSRIIPGFVYDIPELDIKAGIKNNGDEESYLEMLKTYADMIVRHIAEIEELMAAHDIPNATIKIHALKSTSRIIGASDIGEVAQYLENAGKANDTVVLETGLPELLERCRNLGERLAPLNEKEETADDRPPIDEDQLSQALSLLKNFAEVGDIDGITGLIGDLDAYSIPGDRKKQFEAVKEAIDNFDYELIPEILS